MGVTKFAAVATVPIQLGNESTNAAFDASVSALSYAAQTTNTPAGLQMAIGQFVSYARPASLALPRIMVRPRM